jgi:hypothetical protein
MGRGGLLSENHAMSEAKAGIDCLTDEKVDGFVLERVEPAAWLCMLGHVAQCSYCQQRAALTRDFISALCRAVAEPVPHPAVDRVEGRGKVDSAQPGARCAPHGREQMALALNTRTQGCRTFAQGTGRKTRRCCRGQWEPRADDSRCKP